ncbi:unnamed protein product [Oikopleura dioica]|uniref:CUB domain-containing protein n=1 Tax=Oikopleura dioica TaxID=34765 RepID=E4Z208_OIKDI|nr:unnamed protein product [Oikopleura dioica]
MKISPLLVTAVIGKPSEEGIAPRFSVSRTIGQCGGSFIGETEVDIKSPGFPSYYGNNLNCVWVVQHDCAESFTITPRSFALEASENCYYDNLSFLQFEQLFDCFEGTNYISWKRTKRRFQN